jgi:hypothetical protein
MALQVKPVQVRHAHVENETRGAFVAAPLKKFARGRETLYIQLNGFN